MTRARRFDPSLWASRKPFGLGEQRPNNYLEIWKALWQNRDNLGYAWRILNHGVCDGCSLGTKGMHDWTLDEVHLCNIRLRLLRLNTMPALDPALLADVSPLRRRSSAELRALGRLPYPMLRRRGEPGFTRVSWDQALDLVAERVRASFPARLGVYLTSRGEPNENYYAAQKAVRAMGTNSIDNAARICHSPSTVSLKQTVGVAATTCSYSDMIGSDLIVFIGSNVANNQPVMMKYLYHAKREGTRIALVNPYQEPGMMRYWVPPTSRAPSSAPGSPTGTSPSTSAATCRSSMACSSTWWSGTGSTGTSSSGTPPGSTRSPPRSPASHGRSWSAFRGPRGRRWRRSPACSPRPGPRSWCGAWA